MHAPTWTGDTRANVALGAFSKECHYVPDEWRRALLWHPRLEVIGGHHAAEPRLLGGYGVVDDFGRTELLEHRGVPDFCGTLTHDYSSPMGLPCAPMRSGTISMRIRCCVLNIARFFAKRAGSLRYLAAIRAICAWATSWLSSIRTRPRI